jgi:mono/diheme cytochrome c family protein
VRDEEEAKMLRRVLVVAVVAFASTAGVANAQPKVATAPIKQTSPADAKEMFDSYCAVCHGKEAKGNGPAAAALTKAPADLTRISARNKGTFPDVRVRRFIEGLDEVTAHGTRDMPIWGGLFRSLNAQNPDIAQIRIAALTNYLKSLQQ